MKLSKTWLTMALGLVLICAGGSAPAAEPEYQYAQTKELVKFVQDAAKLIQSQGEEAFKQFADPEGPWRKGEMYIFVDTPQGVEVVNGAFPELNGQNLYDLKDARGKPMVRNYTRRALAKKGGEGIWSHYLWPKPGQIDPTWKTSYIMRAEAPSGKVYVVGAGLYNMKMERRFIYNLVNRAAALIAAKGEAAFPELRATDGPFVFHNTYVFVDSAKGVELVNPDFPGLEGRSLWRLRNQEGRSIVQEYINLAKKRGQGWIGYYWPKPGDDAKHPSIKHTYVKGVTHGGKFYVLGCGAYLD